MTTSHLTDETTSQPTKPPKNGGKVAGYSQPFRLVRQYQAAPWLARAFLTPQVFHEASGTKFGNEMIACRKQPWCNVHAKTNPRTQLRPTEYSGVY
jgi:hypothetical protein